MDNEIYQLVKHLSHRGLDNLSYEEKRIKLWQRAVKKWNKSHEPTILTLEEVYHAFKNKWPHIYGGEPLDSTLYLSFSHIDYCFIRNSKGQVCGGIWPRIDEMPHFPVNMTAGQIVDLASLLRTVPEKSDDWEKDEDTIKEAYNDIAQSCDETTYDNNFQFLYQHLQIIGVSQYMIGLFEESFETFSRALLCLNRLKDERKRSASDEQVEMFSESDKVKYGEFYTMLADNLVYMFHWEEAQWCFETAYDYLKVYEEKDWQEKVYAYYYPENIRQETDQSARCAYLDMAWRFAEFYVKNHRPLETIPLLEKAEAVAKDMNEIEAGRWAEKLESIKNKLKTLRERQMQGRQSMQKYLCL